MKYVTKMLMPYIFEQIENIATLKILFMFEDFEKFNF